MVMVPGSLKCIIVKLEKLLAAIGGTLAVRIYLVNQGIPCRSNAFSDNY